MSLGRGSTVLNGRKCTFIRSSMGQAEILTPPFASLGPAGAS
jgi:hypothetical protein